MRMLGHERWIAHGSDWGAVVATLIGVERPAGCLALHLTRPVVGPDRATFGDLTPDEEAAVEQLALFARHSIGYSTQQATRPQTLGYALEDSPVGLAGWLLEKFWEWTDCGGHPENSLTRARMLDLISLYWFSRTATTSARLYWESWHDARTVGPEVLLPTGCSIYPRDIFRPSRRWAARRYRNLVYWGLPARGGHFPAAEQPGLFVEELRAFWRAAQVW